MSSLDTQLKTIHQHNHYHEQSAHEHQYPEKDNGDYQPPPKATSTTASKLRNHCKRFSLKRSVAHKRNTNNDKANLRHLEQKSELLKGTFYTMFRVHVTIENSFFFFGVCGNPTPNYDGAIFFCYVSFV